ncbi:MAG: NHLP bacteriocin export ABC transporter permease/ATPase subunit [Blautia sp.]|nr:NHLP bacteriocin export ABC transporter permease/ATPase subunit [Blautia sp.]
MGWFDEQIRESKNNDQEVFEESLFHMASVVLGKKSAIAASDDRIVTKVAMEEILKFFHCKSQDIDTKDGDFDEQLEGYLRPHGIMRRRVELTPGWHKDSFGPILGFFKEGTRPVALLPRPGWGYSYEDPETGKKVKLTKKKEALFEKEAICFYRPLPSRKLGIKDLLAYIQTCPSASDYVLILVTSVLVTLVGMLMPVVTRFLTSYVLDYGNGLLLGGTAVFLFCALLSSNLIGVVKNLSTHKLETKASLSVEAALMMRLLSLPVPFYKDYSSGELSSRFTSIRHLCNLLIGGIFTLGLSSVLSLAYIGEVFRLAKPLAGTALLAILTTLMISLLAAIVQTRVSASFMETQAKTSGLSYAFINGVQKIKLVGAEKRAFARWATAYASQAEIRYNTPFILQMYTPLTMAVNILFTLIIYYLAVENSVTPSAYIAFSTAFGMVSGAYMNLSGMALTVSEIKPILKMIEPILEAEPEASPEKIMVTKLRGQIELSRVSFRYRENRPYVLKDVSVKISPGEYVAIVGKTGCGKSTLMRLLLGFETPQRGAIYYDGKDMKKLDKRSLRQHIGSVTQSGSLFQGDIYSNIVISAPHLSMDEAWKAAEVAGIADDIRAMPMQMHTLISEGQGGISGGQKQRLMIARAIAPKPKILLFDEATSALDNRTQSKVSHALDGMDCTRICIAHRLSTIKNGDRILVLDGGNIVEDGSYDELLARGGLFAELVERQRL